MAFALIGAAFGVVATLLFVASAIPMLVRAFRTRDLSSYSPANLIIANVGNLAQTIYVATLPIGPVWLMHLFNLVVSALMLLWWLRHSRTNRGTNAMPPPEEEEEDDDSDYRGDRPRGPFACV